MSLTQTQVSLSESQSSFLQRLARQQGRTVSDVICDLIEKEMQSEPSAEDPIFGIIGLAGSADRVSETPMDRRIYKKDWE